MYQNCFEMWIQVKISLLIKRYHKDALINSTAYMSIFVLVKRHSIPGKLLKNLCMPNLCWTSADTCNTANTERTWIIPWRSETALRAQVRSQTWYAVKRGWKAHTSNLIERKFTPETPNFISLGGGRGPCKNPLGFARVGGVGPLDLKAIESLD